MHKIILCTVLSLCMPFAAFSQKTSDANIVGHITDKNTGEHLSFINVIIEGTTLGTATDNTGHYFLKNLPVGTYTMIAKSMGYKTIKRKVTTEKSRTLEVNFEMEEDINMMDDIVITGNRNEVSRKLSSVVVGIAGPKIYESTYSPSVGCVLNFQPGLRTENNCQNCGFVQVRINGLQGQYTQVMIDSRPVLSALGGVYGLEQYPSEMVERVEVIRGGGSALFGSSAIAGTVNIITKEPVSNYFSAGHDILLIGGKNADNTTNLSGTLVSDDRKAGIHIFGMSRHRSAYDANGDGFSDIPRLKNTNIGFSSYYKPTLYSKIKLEYHSMHEFRRGGDNIDLPPHQAEVAEQTEHDINGGSLTYMWSDPSAENRVNAYVAMQDIKRKSYYGTGMDPNAYGHTSDFTVVTGVQYTHGFKKFLFLPSELTAGGEFNHNGLKDVMLGYGRDMRQDVNIISAYLQNEWKTQRMGILIGARMDKHNMISDPIVSPRVNLRYLIGESLNLRASWATGFRAPQAFDEDLHIAAVGDNVQIIRISPDLKQENSQSFSFSAEYTGSAGKLQYGILAEGFYTRLDDVFILEPGGKDENGNTILVRTNGDGAIVKGINLEGRIALGKPFELQIGATLQNSKYTTPYRWSEDEDAALVKKMLRSPDAYGYFTLTSEPVHDFKISLTGTYTGSMTLEHFAGYIDRDRLEETPSFFDMGIKLAYDIRITPSLCLDLNIGMQNIFDSYQNDLDIGRDRDSKYIYGPSLPRSFFAGLKINLM